MRLCLTALEFPLDAATIWLIGVGLPGVPSLGDSPTLFTRITEGVTFFVDDSDDFEIESFGFAMLFPESDCTIFLILFKHKC